MEESSPIKACMDTAYVQENTRPPKIAENKVQYLHSRYLKFLVIPPFNWSNGFWFDYHVETGIHPYRNIIRYWVGAGRSNTNLIDFFVSFWKVMMNYQRKQCTNCREILQILPDLCNVDGCSSEKMIILRRCLSPIGMTAWSCHNIKRQAKKRGGNVLQ